MNEIKMIPIKQLHPHPDNPRKDLGDLAELADSIRKNGVMQNLTVVEGHRKGKTWVDKGYTIIIGHRRCAAAHEAGVKELPCMVTDMDPQQQLCTMMEENMQREDLTIPEQAYGFQYMLDLGIGTDEIARRTGFAESTVKHRLEIAKLDKKLLKDAWEDENWQMTLKDLMLLEKIKDTERRNLVLKGCKNGKAYFNNAVGNAITEEKREETKGKWKPVLDAAGVQKAPDDVKTWSYGWKTIDRIDLDDERKIPKKLQIEGWNKEKPLYSLEQYGTIYLMQEEEKEKTPEAGQDAEWKEKQKIRKELRTKAEAAVKEMQMMAVNTYYGVGIESSMSEEETVQYLWDLFRDTDASMGRSSLTVLSPLTNSWQVPEDDIEEYKEFVGQKKLSEQLLIYLSYAWRIYDPVDNDGSYDADDGDKLLLTYQALNTLYGFRFSDPELLKVINGTHEKYVKEEEDGQQ